MEKCDNNPSFEMDVDKLPPGEDYRWKKYPTSGGAMYVSDNMEFVKFFVQTGDHNGYAGRKFDIIMEDGSTVTLVGPWSSNSSAVRDITGIDCVECSLLETEGDYPRLRYHGLNIRADVARSICESEDAHLIDLQGGINIGRMSESYRSYNVPSMDSEVLVKPRIDNQTKEIRIKNYMTGEWV